MSVESLLLIRCKESIEELNSVVSSQKGEIDRLEKNSRRLAVELEDKETQRLAMLQEISRLRRQLVQQKMDHDSQLNHHRLQTVAVRKSLDEMEMAHRNLLAHSVQLQHENQMLTERIHKNQLVAKEWQESIVEVNLKIRQNELQRKQLSDQYKKERDTVDRQIELYKAQVVELRAQCQRLNSRSIDYESLLKVKNSELETYHRQELELTKFATELQQQESTLQMLEKENRRLTELLQQHKLTMLRQQEQIDSLSRKLVGLTEQHPPKPLGVLKQNSSAYRSSRSELVPEPEAKRRNSKHTGPEQYPSQAVSEHHSVATSSIKKKLDFEEPPTSKSRRKKSRLEKLGKLESRIRTIMQSLRS